MSQQPAGGGAIVARLSVMMFLQFFLWGAWFVTLGPFMNALGFKPESVGNAYSVAPLAAILSPFFLGVIADRFFASEKVMGVLHVTGGCLLLLAPSLAKGHADQPMPFIGVLLAHMLCYMPTLGLSNTVAFHTMNHPEKQFPLVRVWGTIGWIIAGITVGFVAKQVLPADSTEAQRAASPHFFYVAGGSGIVLGLFSFMLPRTPPPLAGKQVSVGSILGLDALALLKDPSFMVFIACSLLVCIPLAFYYQLAATYAGAVGFEDVPMKMTFGQMSEIGFMLVMPLFFGRLGVKWMLAVGMLAWVVRYGLFGLAWGGPQAEHVKWMVLGGIVLHGICYDFFFVTGQIYTVNRAPKEIRSQAQGFLVFITQGLGMLIGAQVAGRLVGHYTNEVTKAVEWKMVWLIPAGAAGVILLFFVAAFRNPPKQVASA